MPTATEGALLPSQDPSSERSERKRKRRRRRRRSVKAGEETSTKAAAGTRISEDDEATKKKVQEEEEVVSSAPSSPLRRPRLADNYPDPPPEFIKAYKLAYRDYRIKRDRHKDLVTDELRKPSPMFFSPELLPVAEPATNAVLLGARFVVNLSSCLDGDGERARKRCSGFWIDWNDENKTGIVLTTAHLISSDYCSVEQAGEGVDDEYAPHGEVKYYPRAKVTIHLLDGSATAGHLIYLQENYDLAFFRVRADQSVQLPSYNDGVKWGQLVFSLGRDAKFNLTMTHLRPGPSLYERPHYMFFPGKEHNFKYEYGGPIIDLDAKVVGMINSHRSRFLHLLLFCSSAWICGRNLGASPAPTLDWSFQVSKGSEAEQVGIRSGDIIESFNGECVSTTVQLENLLLSLCKLAGNGRNAKIHVSVGVFQVRKLRRKIIEFTVGVSEHLEVIDRGYKYVTLEQLWSNVNYL